MTVTFLALSALVAVVVPSAADLMGIVGGFSCVTYVCLLPAEMGRKIRAEYSDKIESSPAAFLAGAQGFCVCLYLEACTVFGYCAAAQSAWQIFQGSTA